MDGRVMFVFMSIWCPKRDGQGTCSTLAHPCYKYVIVQKFVTPDAGKTAVRNIHLGLYEGIESLIDTL